MGMARGAVCSRSLLFELLKPRPYNFHPPVYGRLIYTVIYMSDRLLSQANPNPRLPSPADMRSITVQLYNGYVTKHSPARPY